MTHDHMKKLAENFAARDIEALLKIAARLHKHAEVDLRFALLVEHYREVRPAAVSPRMGLA